MHSMQEQNVQLQRNPTSKSNQSKKGILKAPQQNPSDISKDNQQATQQITMNIKELIAKSFINKAMNSQIINGNVEQIMKLQKVPQIDSSNESSNQASIINNINNRRKSVMMAMPLLKSTAAHRDGEIDIGTEDENEQLMMKIKLARERIKIRDSQLNQPTPLKGQDNLQSTSNLPGREQQISLSNHLKQDIKKSSIDVAQETIKQFRKQPTKFKKLGEIPLQEQFIDVPLLLKPTEDKNVQNALGSYFKNIFAQQLTGGLNPMNGLTVNQVIIQDPNNIINNSQNQATDFYKKKTEDQIEQIEKMDAQIYPQSFLIPVLMNHNLEKSSKVMTAGATPQITNGIGLGYQVDKPLVIDDLPSKQNKFDEFQSSNTLAQKQISHLSFMPQPILNVSNFSQAFELTKNATLGKKEISQNNNEEDEFKQIVDQEKINPAEINQQQDSNQESLTESDSEISGSVSNFEQSMNHSSNTKSVTQGQTDDDPHQDDENKLHLNNLIFDEQMMTETLPFGIIHPQALWKTIWNVAMLFIIVALAMTVPYRIAFEDQTPIEWIYIDTFIDFIFIFDMIMNFFTAIETDQGEIIPDRKKIIASYAKSWFFVDLTSSIPISLIQKITASDIAATDQNGNSLVNLRIIKLTRLPRLYRLLRLVKLMRLYKSNRFIQTISMQLNLSITTTRLIKSFIMVFFLIHLIGCVWVTIAVLNPFDDPISWITAQGLIDSENIEVYIASIYWAAVSIYTVGYGDITSQNNFEMTCNIIILFFGITLYTYIFSQLSALFSSVSEKDKENKTRERMIIDLAQAYQFPDQLTKRMQFFFSQNSNLISLSKEYGIDQLLEILPPHLKAEITTFLYQYAIDTIQILRDREMRFYGDYLYRFEPMSIKNGSIFAKEGMNANEVFFLLYGCVENENQKKYYLPGTVFGETDVVLGRKRLDTYKTKEDCYILKLNKNTFIQIMDEFNDFREDIQKMVMEREKNRLERIQQQRLRKEMQEQFNELNKLVEKIDFEQIQNGSCESSLKTSQGTLTPPKMTKFVSVDVSPLRQKSLSFDKKDQMKELGGSYNQPNTFQTVVASNQNRSVSKIIDYFSPANLFNSENKKFDQDIGALKPIKYKAQKSIRSVFSKHVADDAQSSISSQKRKTGEGTDDEKPFIEMERTKEINSVRLGPIQILKQLMMFKESVEDTIEKQSQFNKSKTQRFMGGGFTRLGSKRFSNADQKPQLKKEDSIQSVVQDSRNMTSFNNMIIIDQLETFGGKVDTQPKYQSINQKDSLNPLKRSSTENFGMKKKPIEQKLEIPIARIDSIQEQESQMNEEEFFLKNKEKPSQVPLSSDEFNEELRSSLERVLTATQHQEERVVRDKTQREKPVDTGGYQLQYEQIPEEESMKTSQSLTENSRIEDNDIEDISDLKQLKSNINLCMESIDFTKKMIEEYIKIFEISIQEIGEDGNEIFRSHFEQGIKGLNSYLAIMNMIQGLASTMNVQQLGTKLTKAQQKSQVLDKRYYFLETRVKMVSEVIVKRLKVLEKEKERMLQSKQLIVKKNPLLDERDDQHNIVNKRLVDREPTNM